MKADDYEEPTKFGWEIVNEWKVTDLTGPATGLLLTYETGDGEDEKVQIATSHAKYLYQCIERVQLERDWGKANASGEEIAARSAVSPSQPYENFFRTA